MRLPDLAFTDGTASQKTIRLARAHGSSEPVGDLVRALRKEMPAADNPGQARRPISGSGDQHRYRDQPNQAFLKNANLTSVGYFTDVSAKVFQDRKSVGRALGMPTSVLVDGKGCESGTIAGPAEWDSDDAVKLISAAMKPVRAGF